MASQQAASVGKVAPDFRLNCTQGRPSTRREVNRDDYRGRWLILAFYPRDFSLVCPTELTALSERFEEFNRRGSEILGISTDSIESHEHWINTPRSQSGLGGLSFPLASDPDGTASRAYGVYLEHEHVALRGLFIIDPNSVLEYQGVHNLSVGRRSEEVLRVLAALQTGGMCPENWLTDSPALDPTRLLGQGSMISHYRIEMEIGRGSFAAVFRALDTTLQRTVALKVFMPQSLLRPSAALAEARTGAALNHPNVCTVFAVDSSEGVPVIAMAYLLGRPLSKVLQSGALPLNQVTRIAHQVALGMAAVHAIGIVHGDLKPANIMLTDEGVAKIMDFGLSHRDRSYHECQEDMTCDLTLPSNIVGTPSYMSPEQSRGEPVTAAGDVFSLGIILYEMLTGRKAFQGDSILPVLEQVRNVDANRFAAEAPEPFDEILEKALIANPRQRIMTMNQIASILQQQSGGLDQNTQP